MEGTAVRSLTEVATTELYDAHNMYRGQNLDHAWSLYSIHICSGAYSV